MKNIISKFTFLFYSSTITAMMHETLRDLIPHPKNIDLTTEACRRVYWPKVVLIGSLNRAYPEMVRLYRDFEEHKVNALVPWAFFEDHTNLRERGESHWADVAEKFNVETHLQRIRASNIAYVINPDGYIGTNSTIDIGAALEAGKPVYSMEIITDNGIAVMMSGVKTPGEIISIAQREGHQPPTKPYST